MRKLRTIIYNVSLNLGLFFLMPLTDRLPAPFSKWLLKLKAFTRFLLGSYRAYINRPDLKNIAIRNLMDTLGIDKKTAKEKLYRLMQLEVFAEKHGFLFDRYTVSDLENRFVIHGLETLDNELRKGKGVVFTTVHSGDNELFILFLSLKGYNIYGLYDGNLQHKKPDNPLEKFAILKDHKITGRVGKLYTGKGMRGIFNMLSRNGIILWMVDLPVTHMKRKAIIDFFGKKIATDNSFWTTASKAGASLLPYINIYDYRNDKHVIHIGRPIDFTRNTIQDLFCFYEAFIEKAPESWIGWYMLDMLAVNS